MSERQLVSPENSENYERTKNLNDIRYLNTKLDLVTHVTNIQKSSWGMDTRCVRNSTYSAQDLNIKLGIVNKAPLFRPQPSCV